MGAIAEAIMAYAQPLIDQTDGSIEQMNKALAMSQMCYNLALQPEENRQESILSLQHSLELDDTEFEDFCQVILRPMIRRHQEMFPPMHNRRETNDSKGNSPVRPRPKKSATDEATVVPDRYAPCACGSGQKYKFCCGKKDV